jgi:hypothetical protein
MIIEEKNILPTINKKYKSGREIMENPAQQDERDYKPC